MRHPQMNIAELSNGALQYKAQPFVCSLCKRDVAVCSMLTIGVPCPAHTLALRPGRPASIRPSTAPATPCILSRGSTLKPAKFLAQRRFKGFGYSVQALHHDCEPLRRLSGETFPKKMLDWCPQG